MEFFDKNLELILQGALTDDAVGSVLRMHLLLERCLDEYLEFKVTTDLKSYVKPTNFAAKLGVAAAFGLPVPLLAPMAMVNKIRNDLAHRTDPLHKDQIRELVRKMDGLRALGMPPVDQFKLTLRGEAPINFGQGGVLSDFVMLSTNIFVQLIRHFGMAGILKSDV